ncbi:hypothetical protein BDZ89DRAFT_1037033 [Hymenopellis radicata]|nr:hypothetical protein BDZ89DRAFT_1037033 [Hymenopellis radicata]
MSGLKVGTVQTVVGLRSPAVGEGLDPGNREIRQETSRNSRLENGWAIVRGGERDGGSDRRQFQNAVGLPSLDGGSDVGVDTRDTLTDSGTALWRTTTTLTQMREESRHWHIQLVAGIVIEVLFNIVLEKERTPPTDNIDKAKPSNPSVSNIEQTSSNGVPERAAIQTRRKSVENRLRTSPWEDRVGWACGGGSDVGVDVRDALNDGGTALSKNALKSEGERVLLRIGWNSGGVVGATSALKAGRAQTGARLPSPSVGEGRTQRMRTIEPEMGDSKCVGGMVLGGGREGGADMRGVMGDGGNGLSSMQREHQSRNEEIPARHGRGQVVVGRRMGWYDVAGATAAQTAGLDDVRPGCPLRVQERAAVEEWRDSAQERARTRRDEMLCGPPALSDGRDVALATDRLYMNDRHAHARRPTPRHSALTRYLIQTATKIGAVFEINGLGALWPAIAGRATTVYLKAIRGCNNAQALSTEATPHGGLVGMGDTTTTVDGRVFDLAHLAARSLWMTGGMTGEMPQVTASHPQSWANNTNFVQGAYSLVVDDRYILLLLAYIVTYCNLQSPNASFY